MANKRMFSKQITTSDAFVDMPMSSQLLYFHLNMEADDDGFVGNPKRITRYIGASDDDLKILLAKRFILSFENGVIVIKHWRLHNKVRKDMYQETQYLDEKNTLKLKDNLVYTEIRNGSVTDPLHRLDKIRLDKNTSETSSEGVSSKKEELPEWLDKEIWSSWVDYRKEKKQSLTSRSISLQLKELENDKSNHKEIIEQSIRNGWTGLFPVKNTNQKQSKKTTNVSLSSVIEL